MGVEKMEARTKLREERTALKELKERVEALLRERKYAQVLPDFSRGNLLGALAQDGA